MESDDDDDDSPTIERENLLDAVVRNVQNQNNNSFNGGTNGIRCAAHIAAIMYKRWAQSIGANNKKCDQYVSKARLQACVARTNFKTKLSRYLVIAFNARSDSIFNTPEMECCLFLDPRFRNVITREPIAYERTKLNSINLWNRLQSLRNSATNDSNASSDLNFSFDAQAELEKELNPNQNMTIDLAIDLFQPPKDASKQPVLDSWESQKHSMLHEVAMALFSIPPTQVKIESDFSILGYIFSDRRYQLTAQHLEQILLINLNKYIFYDVKKEWLNKM